MSSPWKRTNSFTIVSVLPSPVSLVSPCSLCHMSPLLVGVGAGILGSNIFSTQWRQKQVFYHYFRDCFHHDGGSLSLFFFFVYEYSVVLPELFFPNYFQTLKSLSLSLLSFLNMQATLTLLTCSHLMCCFAGLVRRAEAPLLPPWAPPDEES